MTKENLTSIVVVIDRSGSMAGLTTDTVGGYNNFLEQQKQVEGSAELTLCLFNTDYHLVYDSSPLTSIPNLDAKTYSPNGGTALLDALGSTIDTVGAKLAARDESERPSKVIVLVITDGQENSSKRFKKEQIKEKISHQREVYNWEFVFMGANIDAVDEGTSLGISAKNSLNYTASAAGTAKLYGTVSQSMSSYRVSANNQVDFFNQNTTPGLGAAQANPVPPVVVDTTTVTTPVVSSTPVIPSRKI
jgi:uncharacterized protein YegL